MPMDTFPLVIAICHGNGAHRICLPLLVSEGMPTLHDAGLIRPDEYNPSTAFYCFWHQLKYLNTTLRCAV